MPNPYNAFIFAALVGVVCCARREKARFAENLFNKQYSCNNFFYNTYSGWGMFVIYTNFAEIVTRKLRVMVQIANIMQLFLLKHDTQFIICAFLFKS